MATLEDLQKAEDEVLEILAVTAETVKELKAMPTCNAEKLAQLSTRFVELGRSVQGRLLIGSNKPEDVGSAKESIVVEQDLETMSALQALTAKTKS